MNIETWPLDKLKEYPKNARKITDKAVDRVAMSLQQYGWKQPVVVDKDGVIVIGHVRTRAARKLGWTEAPVLVATDLTPQQIRGLRLADNRTNQFTDWDLDILKLEMLDLKALDFNLDFTAFEMPEIESMLKPSDIDDQRANEAPAVPEHPVTQPGDLWICGNHRVLCGDSTKAEDVARLMDGQLADMVFTDPPFNVNVTGGTHDPRDKKNHGKGPKIQNDQLSDGEFGAFLVASFQNYARAMKVGAVIYVCHADTKGRAFRDAFELDAGFLLHAVIIWVKQQFVFGRSDYHWQHEPILYGWQKGAAHQFYGPRDQSTTWGIDRPMRSALEHPTQKPVELVDKAIRNSSKAGDLVLDLFGGSGSTLIAAERLSRTTRMMEIDPKYCDVIISRWEKFTGRTAGLAEDGRTFSQVAHDRLTERVCV